MKARLVVLAFIGWTIYSIGTVTGIIPPPQGGAATATPQAAVPAGVVPAPPTPAGNVLTRDQIRQAWLAYGGDPAEADTAVGVALAESRGDRTRISPPNDNGTVDRGLFQMNSIHGACSTIDLAENVRCAADLQRRGSWSHWTTYRTGEYRKFM